jgi:predicted Zn-ribbon and HTH transcriptional regulator
MKKDKKEVLPMRKCKRCGHTWMKRTLDKEPLVCARCKSPYWNTERKENPFSKPEKKESDLSD